jgi:hypothetical protein
VGSTSLTTLQHSDLSLPEAFHLCTNIRSSLLNVLCHAMLDTVSPEVSNTHSLNRIDHETMLRPCGSPFPSMSSSPSSPSNAMALSPQ